MAAKGPARASLRYAKAPLSPRYQWELHQLLGHCFLQYQTIGSKQLSEGDRSRLHRYFDAATLHGATTRRWHSVYDTSLKSKSYL